MPAVRKSLLLLAAGVGFPVAFALGAAPAPAATNGCEAAKALTLIGREAPDDATVKKLTGARKVRRVAPGDAATLDYKPDRVTLGIENGKVASTRCG